MPKDLISVDHISGLHCIHHVILFVDAERVVLFLGPRVVRHLAVWVGFGGQQVLDEAVAARVVDELK